MKKGFTLAEVLITLGIIGVVATMTIASVIKKYTNYTFAQRLKQSYSLISQSIQNSACIIENPNWVKELDATKTVDMTREQLITLFENCIVGNLKRAQIDGYINPLAKGFPTYRFPNGTLSAPTTGTGTIYYTMKLANGSFVFVNVGTNSDGTYTAPRIYIDINGQKGPNVLGKDLFFFVLTYNSKLIIPSIGKSRNEIINTCKSNIISTSDTMCSALLILDNWVFTDDYLNLLK